jgi:uncharacterized protein YegJ (DUF2314 family)
VISVAFCGGNHDYCKDRQSRPVPKLILHITVALGIWFALAYFGVHWGYRLAAIFAGAVLVHLVWVRYLLNPYVYLGAMPVADDDPLMAAARRKARETFAEFLALYPAHQADAMVKFRFETDHGTRENLWADLVSIDGQTATIYVRTPPRQHGGPFERRQQIPAERIIDWQIEMPDGTIRGGYTNRALFQIYKREAGAMHPKLLAVYRRFQDADDAGA